MQDEEFALWIWHCYFIVIYAWTSLMVVHIFVRSPTIRRVLSETIVAAATTAASVINMPIIGYHGWKGAFFSTLLTTAFCEMLGWLMQPEIVEADFRKPSGDPAATMLNCNVWSKLDIALCVVGQVGAGVGTMLLMGEIIVNPNFCDFKPKQNIIIYFGFEATAAIAPLLLTVFLRTREDQPFIPEVVMSCICKAHIACLRFQCFRFDGTYVPSMIYVAFLCPKVTFLTVAVFGVVPLVVSALIIWWNRLYPQWALWNQVEAFLE